MKIYMRVTGDKYELPVLLAANVQELADKCGVKRSTVESAISKFYHGRLKTCPYRVVEIEEEE